MRGIVNDFLRQVISVSIRILGVFLDSFQCWRIARFWRNQQSLRRRYGITNDTPVSLYGAELEAHISDLAKHIDRAMFASTSGSTGSPKCLLYTPKRLRTAKLTYIDVFARACWAMKIDRTSLYVFGSFTKDESLTTLLLDDKRMPDYFTTLQAPYRVQCNPVIRDLASRYGATAVRLWLLTIANPGILYSTNPSTIATFLDEVANDWPRSQQLIKDSCEKPETFDRQVRALVRRIESRGSGQRLALVAQSSSSLPLSVYAPGVSAYMCWTGGYVKPFLDRLETHLPPTRYRLIPMYSMSTETIETVTCIRGSEVSFLPLASCVLYEFLEEGSADEYQHLLGPRELEIGKNYSMIVSDSYGLRRYQTEDIFRCDSEVSGLPNLSFLRRRGLEYSFTGEKLTAEQLNIVYQELRKQYPNQFRNAFLTCFPCQPRNENLPHYRILSVGQNEVARKSLGQQCDEQICELNAEYKSKRLSGRLGPVEFINVSTGEFIELTSSSRTSWETQFKILPLYRELLRVN